MDLSWSVSEPRVEHVTTGPEVSQRDEGTVRATVDGMCVCVCVYLDETKESV